MICIKNGLVHDGLGNKPGISDILIDAGKIKAVGSFDIPAGCEIIDASNLEVFPGFIDAHTHIGLFGTSDPNTKDDVEKTQPCTPENQIVDAIDPFNEEFARARRVGVTTVCIAPGSVNVIGGTAAAVKTVGRRIDDMILKNPVAMKVAFGENPKAKLKAGITSRATISSVLRDQLTKTKEYMSKRGSVPYNAGFEALIPVIEGKLPLKAHVHRASDIFDAIRIAKEFNVKLTLEHVSDGALIADILAKEGYPITSGPFVSMPAKEENRNSDASVAVTLIKAGCSVCVNTDSKIAREDMLPICAGMLIREGLEKEETLKTITINAAKHLGVEDRVGSIEVGKDADIVIANGNPLTMGMTMKVFIDGVCCYERA